MLKAQPKVDNQKQREGSNGDMPIQHDFRRNKANQFDNRPSDQLEQSIKQIVTAPGPIERAHQCLAKQRKHCNQYKRLGHQ